MNHKSCVTDDRISVQAKGTAESTCARFDLGWGGWLSAMRVILRRPGSPNAEKLLRVALHVAKVLTHSVAKLTGQARPGNYQWIHSNRSCDMRWGNNHGGVAMGTV